MTASMKQSDPRCRRGRARAVGLAIVAAWLMVRGAAAADSLTVVLDQAQVAKLPDGVATIVIGNPLIADVAIQPGGLMVVTGKGYGTTNLIALDRTGAVLMSKTIQVNGPHDAVVVYRGFERESYSCAPLCERRIMLGDSQPYFDSTLGQTGGRNGQATAGGGQQQAK